MSAVERTVLIVSYEFPPAGGPGVQRAAKFAKYLPEHGWRPVVLTARPAAARPRDESLLRDVAGVEVHVTAGSDLSAAIARALRPFKRRSAGPPAIDFEDELVDVVEPTRARWGAGSGSEPRRARPSAGSTPDPSMRPALSSRIASWISVPDDRMFWRWIAGRAAARLADAVGADAVFSTAPPYTAHLVGMRAAHGRPWVADFRDPWAASGHHPRPTAWHRHRDEVWERRVVQTADAITCISEPIAESLVGTPRRPALVIPNGYDRADLAPRAPRPGLPLRLVYTGAFYGDRSPLPFLDALAGMLIKRPGLGAELEVELIGASSEVFAASVGRRGLADIVTLAGYRPHDEALAALASADAALLFIAPGDKSRATYTGKLFEYLGMGVPILAMAPDGVAADLVRRAEAGTVVSPDHPAAIAGAVDAMIAAKREGSLERPPRADIVAAYDRRAQTAALAALLSELVS